MHLPTFPALGSDGIFTTGLHSTLLCGESCGKVSQQGHRMAPSAVRLRKLENFDSHAVGLTQPLLGEDSVNRSPHGHLPA
jgi:hypothetical protein